MDEYSDDYGKTVCPKCQGTGQVAESGGAMPDDYSIPIDCSGCGGGGLVSNSPWPFCDTPLDPEAVRIAKEKHAAMWEKLIEQATRGFK